MKKGKMQHIEKLNSERHVPMDTVLVAIFGAMWGFMEITLGVTLKGLRLPLGGAILTTIAVVIFLTGRYFVKRRGSILMMGAVAAILKIFSIGTVIAGPFIAILIEATLAEILISVFGINRISYLSTGIILLLYTILHPFLAQGLIFGANIYKIYLETFRLTAKFFKLDYQYLGLIFLAYVAVHLSLGTIAGWLGWLLPKQVEFELQQIKIEKGEG